MNVLVLLALVGFMTATRTFNAEESAFIGSITLLVVGYLLLTAHFMGKVVARLQLPKLTGYIGAGILAGASGLDLIPDEALDNAKIFTGVAVALIALTAGSELELRRMRALWRAIGWITGLAVVGGALVLAGTVLGLSRWLPFMAGLTPPQAAAIALVLGAVMAAQSPAVVVALRTELQADGPVCRTVLGVVVIADLVVIVLFTGASTVADALMGGSAELGQTVLRLAWELFGSIAVGIGVGGPLAFYLRRVGHDAGLIVLVVAFVVAEVGHRVGLDPLLVALAAGLLVRNATEQGDALHHAIEGSALPVYLVFFAVTGATIHLHVLAVVGVPAVILVLVRASAFMVGARVACRIAGAEDVVRRFVGFGLLPQAGLALALSTLFARTFPELGPDAAALTLGIVALNELVAPVAYRLALIRSGEAGAAGSESALPVPVAAAEGPPP
ncbi:cation:proton antiporter [Paraliomyxa miuraensis]|uniref:cation:proton antiporter n=1 Tax=Paraliomyxa miuraensis TaxID=376150 RepID=UPI00224E7044|nr:cation:proton antiporter [Paraliomyxa miuraensis]MCX4241041.1 cation:proton antiporter [Paraliomyxa miuraensis]